MVSILSLISNSSRPLSKPLRNVLSAPTTVGITVTIIFHSFLSSLAKSKYLFIFSLSFIFYLWPDGRQNPQNSKVFFFLIKTMSGLLAGIRRFVCISRSQRMLCVSFSRTDFGFVHIPLGSMVKFQFLSQLPVNRLSRSVVSSLVLLLR